MHISHSHHPWVKSCLLCLADLKDTVTGPKEEWITPVFGSPVTPPGLIEEAPSISPALSDSEVSSERRTLVPYISLVDTAAPYGLDQLESEGTHALKGIFPRTG